MRATIFKIAKIFSLWIVLVFVSLLLSAFSLPWVFDTIEKITGMTLPYEGTLRLSLLFAYGLLLVGAYLYLLIRGTRHGWYIWIGFTLSFVSLTVIFFGDTHNRLMNEYSWIRYTTSVLLFSTGLYSLFHARAAYTRRHGIWIILLLTIVGAAFIFAGLDELVQIHEKIGNWMTEIFHKSAAFGDFITLIYAFIGIICVFFILYKGRIKLHLIAENRHFTILFASAATVYLISTLFDTADFMILDWTQRLIAKFLSDSQFVIGDAWVLIWAPRNFLNSLEEIFEHTAALLFLLAFFFLDLRNLKVLQAVNYSLSSKKYYITALIIGSATGLVVITLIILSLPNTFPRSPLIGELKTTLIAGKTDGLLHTDDLEYKNAWGLLIGNENKGEVLNFKNETLARLQDPNGVLGQVEAVTADEKQVYASDGARGIIAVYNSKDPSWKILWSRKDGIYAPEGLTIAQSENALYVLDESKNSITRLKQGELIQSWKPTHELWQAPEGIVFDSVRKHLIVTDDVSGAVFVIEFGSSIKLIARVSKAEDVTVTPNGVIYLTENGSGKIISMSPDGLITQVAQFRRAYRDLQGIALDENKNIYVIVSDGYNSESIMPSQLFKFSL